MRRPSRRTVLLAAAGLPLAAGGVYWATHGTGPLELFEPEGLEPLAVAPDGRWLVAANFWFTSDSAACHTRFTVWDLTTGRLVRVLAEFSTWPNRNSRMLLSPDGRRLAWQRRGHRDEPPWWVGLLDTTTWETVAVVDDDCRLVDFTVDGAGLLYVRGEKLWRYDLATGTSRDTGVPLDSMTRPRVALLAGDRVAVEQTVENLPQSRITSVSLWELTTGRRVAVLVERADHPWPTVSADGRLLFCDGRVFDTATAREVWRDPDGMQNVESVAFVGPRLLVVRFDAGVRVIDTATWADAGWLDTGQRVMYRDIHPSPDGTMAVFGGSDRLTLVDFAGDRGHRLVEGRTSVAEVLWSGDSRTLVVGRPGDYIRGQRNKDAYSTQVWKVPPVARTR